MTEIIYVTLGLVYPAKNEGNVILPSAVVSTDLD